MAFVHAILLAYAKYGVDPAKALAAASITPAQLARPKARIDAEQMETIAAAAMQELDDEALGWFSRRLPWGTYGLLCRASLGSQSLRVALKRWCRHHALLTSDIRLDLVEEGSVARVSIEERCELGAMREFCLLASLRYLHGYACWLVDSQLPLVEVTFPFAAPPHASVYALLFPGPVRFEASRASLALDRRYLELPPKRDEAALDRMLQHALPLTVRQYRRDRLLVERVRSHLSVPSHHGSTATEVASALHVSLRTLHRQLASEGASLQAIKDDVRRARALDLLRRSDLSIDQLATRLGFRNVKSFARAFKTWTGQSASSVRRAHASAREDA